MSIASSVFGALGRRKKAPAPRKLKDFEKRAQAAQPFDAIRQQLMAQGVSATPELMQSYQDQAASQKAKPSGGPVGKRSSVGAGGLAPSLALKGGPMAKRSGSGQMNNAMLQRFGVTDPTQRLNLLSGNAGNRNRTLGLVGGSMPGFLQALLGGGMMAKPEKPEMPGGSFYQQTLTGGPAPGESWLSKSAGDNPYQWNRTAREGTKSYQSPF